MTVKKYQRVFKEQSITLPSWGELMKQVGKQNEGLAYIVHGTLTNMKSGAVPQKAFVDACENENFHGKRPDIVRDRRLAADILRDHYNIEVDAVHGF